MSFEVVAAGDPAPAGSSREPWPEGQVYVGDDADATKALWDKWSREDAYPLVFKQNLELKQEYRAMNPKTIENLDETVTTAGPEGKFVIPKNCHEYRANGYARGGIAWSAAYVCAHRTHGQVIGNVPPDAVFNTSDFDTVACTLLCSKSSPSRLPDIPESVMLAADKLLRYQTKDGRADKNVAEAWPGRWRCGGLGNSPTFRPLGMEDVTVDYGHWDGHHLDWEKLASFFGDKLVLNEKSLTEHSIKGKKYEDLVSTYSLDFADRRHGQNLASLPGRYGLDDAVPYLMRVEGFGFVETPTIQVGQLIDTLSDYERCGNQHAIGIKAKYRRRLERIAHSWIVHCLLKKAGYKHGPHLAKSSPFVLSGVVADEIGRLRGNRALTSLLDATDPENGTNCRLVEVNNEEKKVVMGESVRCDEKSARMNCRRMLDHPFQGRGEPKGLYAKKNAWSVGLKERHDPKDPPQLSQKRTN